MSYTVIARRWRPQKLDDVVGQRAVTQTLRNAIANGRIAQAFVFAGPRGVGKTTTARILSRMLNCEQGPTPDPCGVCDPCREIAEGRDMDVLELDAATHTGIDNIREVIISGLAILPARDRYKVFVIDEVHQLSASSFNALLKSIEEPPPHVAFIMATTAPDKIPDTIVSRSQVFEFKTISSRLIADQLSKIAKADGIDASPEAIALVARSAEGSMRDAETAFDQVIAFAGNTVTVEDVATVLGLVGRDLLFDVDDGRRRRERPGGLRPRGPRRRGGVRAPAPVPRTVAPGARPARAVGRSDAVLGSRRRARGRSRTAAHAHRPVLPGRSPPFVRRADARRDRGQERGRAALQLRDGAAALDPPAQAHAARGPDRSPRERRAASGGARLRAPARILVSLGGPQAVGRAGPAGARTSASPCPGASRQPRPRARRCRQPPRPPAPPAAEGQAGSALKDLFLSAIEKKRPMVYGTIVAQAQRIDVEGDRILFRFASDQTMLGDGVAREKAWLEELATGLAGRTDLRWRPTSRKATRQPRRPVRRVRPSDPAGQGRDLKAAAMKDPVLQSLLDVIPAEVKDITELKKP